MANVLPRHVICALGTWRDLDAVDAIVRPFGASGFELDREFSQLWRDARMTSAFEASYDRVAPSMKNQDWQGIQGYTAVAYVLSPPIRREQAADVSGLALLVTAALLRAGGVAAKGEAAGIAHGRDRWLEMAADFSRARAQGDNRSGGATLYQAWVRRPLVSDGDGVYYTCGMHLLGERDIEVGTSVEPGVALEWMDLLGLYLVADRPARPVKDGDGFRLSETGPRRVMRLRPCDRYEEDDFLFNPYGYIRLEPDQ